MNYLKLKIINYIRPNEPEFYTRENTRNLYMFYNHYSVVVPEYQTIAQKYYRMYHYLTKYTQYLDVYESNQGTMWLDERIDYKGNPVLLDLMSTGLQFPFIKPSVSYWKKEMILEIQEIISLFPSSVYCDIGVARCRNNITPLYFAVHNTSIPIEAVKILHQWKRKMRQKNITSFSQEIQMERTYDISNALNVLSLFYLSKSYPIQV